MTLYFRIFLYTFLLLGLAGFIKWGKVNFLPVSIVFECLIFSAIFTKGLNINRQAFKIFFVFSLYFFVSLLYSVLYKGSNILDFLLIYKSIVYIAIIAFYVGNQFGSIKSFNLFFYLVVSLFFLKYSLSILLGLNYRPVLYLENNFEMLFLTLLFYLKFVLTGKLSRFDWFIVSLIIFMSLSRSAIPVYILVASSIIFDKLTIRKLSFLTIFIALSGYLFSMILFERSGGASFDTIDRVVFFKVFADELSNASIINFFIGLDRISPLSADSCHTLRFYDGLFSYSNDGSCYSVILHSFLFRVILDHGLIILGLLLFSTYKYLRLSKYTKKVSMVVVFATFLNGLSVSSFNSVFFPLIMILFIGFSHLNNIQSNRYSFKND
jgi:hypothetical protein